jgi:hypothetical protein
MDEKLKTEDLITTHNNINTDELLEITQHNHNALNRNNLNNTKYLLKSSVNGLSQIKSLNNKDNTLQLSMIRRPCCMRAKRSVQRKI